MTEGRARLTITTVVEYDLTEEAYPEDCTTFEAMAEYDRKIAEGNPEDFLDFPEAKTTATVEVL